MQKVLAIVGPTASGKTDIAIETALQLNGEIISADSRQVYKYIPIASAIPSEKERKGVKHHFMEELNLAEEFNAGEFGKAGRERIEEIFSRGKQPIITGGSGLYVRSLIDGFFEEEIKDERVRNGLYEKMKIKGKEFLYNELKEIDKIAAATMMPHNFRRVIRALEIYYASGKKISDLQRNKVEINFETVQAGLLLDRKYLYTRVNERVERMLKNGLMKEVEWLKDNGFHYSKNISLNTVGIKEVFRYYEGEINYEEMVSLIKMNSRRYAKRQMTWFRKDKRINWIEVEQGDTKEKLAEKIIELFNSH